jgi:putative transposase
MPGAAWSSGFFQVVETQKGPDMRYCDSILGALLKNISRRSFQALVSRHRGNRYAKSLSAWDHLLAMLFAQLSGAASLRSLEAEWNAHAHHHYHLGSGPVARSTLADANTKEARAAVFAELFGLLSRQAAQHLKREGDAMIRLLDSTPIPLPQLCGWATTNGRTRGMKLHVVYNPHTDQPMRIEITPANVNDVTVGRAFPVEPGAVYVFDKGYCDHGWWRGLDKAGCCFVTRPKTNMRIKVAASLPLPEQAGNGFVVLGDEIGHHSSKDGSKLDFPIRRLTLRIDGGRELVLITNDLDAEALAIGQLYKTRWDIELLFRWLKQHLKIRRFIGRCETAIRIQILTAMIAFLLLRIAARQSRSKLPPIRFAGLVARCLFTRKPLARLDRPPQVNPSQPQSKLCPNQLELAYA